MVNDIIGDFLSRIRNAQLRKKEAIEMPFAKIVESMAKILKEEGFIVDYKVNKASDEVKFDMIEVELKYVNNEPVIRNLRRVSKPGIRKYRGYRDLKPIMNGLGISIISTPQGVMTGELARKKKVGGEVICEIF